ncbi:class I SAM-dependent methyltransferase [Candidatus Woesearchaeota archaeon]|nr:class I SAM-dependent methyltransferase [Candidatus Woesearchaeota archaeon]
MAKQIAFHCGEGARVLDVGCNDGLVAYMIKEYEPSLAIVGVDVQARKPAMIKRILYDGRRLPFPDNSFDVVMANDVLHHVANMGWLLKEMRRVSKRYIIIKDHQKCAFFSQFFLSLADCFGNLPYGIPCVFNYKSLHEWAQLFGEADLKLAVGPENLELGFGLIRQHNPIFKLEKLNAQNL